MAEDLFASLLAGMNDGLVVYDESGTVLFANEAAARFLDVEVGAEGVIARIDALEAYGVLDPRTEPVTPMREALSGRPSRSWTAWVPGEGSTRRVVSLSARPLPPHGKTRRAALTARDVTREAELEEALRGREIAAEAAASAARLSALVDHLSYAVMFEDASNRITLVNRAYCKMFDVQNPAAVVGERVEPRFLPPVADLDGFLVLRDMRLFERDPALSDRIELLDGRVLERDYVPVDVAGVVEGHFWCYRDVTERERAREHLAELSNRDELTALYNRRGFVTLAEQWLRLAARTKRTPLLLFVDVNGMKPVNDRLGHALGDRMLRDTADLLRATFRDSDIVARLGGDEFVVLAVDALPTHAGLLAERLQRNVDRFNQGVQRPYAVSVSVGVSVWDPAQPRGVAELLAEADARMYEAKRRRPPSQGRVRAASGV